MDAILLPLIAATRRDLNQSGAPALLDLAPRLRSERVVSALAGVLAPA